MQHASELTTHSAISTGLTALHMPVQSLQDWGQLTISDLPDEIRRDRPALPISGLSFICPVAAAGILVHRERGSIGLRELLKRSFDFGRIQARAWLLPAILLEPAIMILSYVVVRQSGVAIPLPQFVPAQALALLLALFVAALGEELGWSGYAADPLQDRFGALSAGLLIGGVWVSVHIVQLLQAG
jgi:uncharacterized protein